MSKLKRNQGIIALLLPVCLLFVGGMVLASDAPKTAEESKSNERTFPLDSMDGLEVLPVHEAGAVDARVRTAATEYRGRRCVQVLVEDANASQKTLAGGQSLAIIPFYDFGEGVIEADIAATPREGAPEGTRGFIGIAFRVQDHGSRFEAFYLRMTNGRADDQLRRNHSTQYVSHPDFPWYRLRKETPGQYESYVDLEAGAWVKIKIVVVGATARLFVNNATEPSLVVNDLKLGTTRGKIALWTGSDTDAHFSNLKVR